MSKRQLIVFPNQILKQVCKPITFPLNDQTQQNILQLKTTFRESFLSKNIKTLGLAAPQIGVLQRFFIIPKSINYAGISIQKLKSVVRNFTVYINPKVIEHSQQKCVIVENCLSMQNDEMYSVQRSESIKIEYYDVDGQKIEQKLSGIRARVFLHENDHLDGKTMDEIGTLVINQTKTIENQSNLFSQVQK